MNHARKVCQSYKSNHKNASITHESHTNHSNATEPRPRRSGTLCSGRRQSHLIRRLRKPRSLLKPGNQRSLFRIGKPCRRMHRQIEPERHIATLNLLHNMPRMLLHFIPLRKIQMTPPIVHVALIQPRNRRNIRIPGPNRLITMAVKARAPRQIASLWTIPNRFLNHRRIRVLAPKRHQLYQHTNTQQSHQDSISHSPDRLLRLANRIAIHQILKLLGAGRRLHIARDDFFVGDRLAVHLFIGVDIGTQRRTL